MTHLELAFESGDESLSVRSFRVEEGLNAFFTVAITARSVDPDLDLTSFVGQDAAFFLAGGVERQRRWTGVCSRMEQVRVEPAGLSTYDLTIMPRLWFLTQRRNHRIFQHQSIPSILQRLLAEWGIEPVWNLDRGQYPGLELRIQYGESDYAFLSRLVEEAGITFFFVDQRADDPEQGSRLVFEDRPQGAERRPELLPFVDAPEAAQAGRLEYLTAVRVSDQVRPGKHVVRDFDFRRPSHRLLGDASAGAGGLTAMLEQYHYLPGAALAETGQGGDTPVGDDKGVGRHADATGQRLAQRSLDSHRALKRAVHFQTNAFDLAPGVVFAVDNHPRSDLAFDKNLLVVHVLLTGAVGEAWTVSGKALFADQPHYPAHVTPKPRIVGVQSAVVVGPEGQEIHTDEYGRVRVQFHWDREGQFNEESFVWIRVSQGWAGGGYGMISLPRVGHEVLVQFMEGDPDSPLIVGRAFNATATVPYALPDHKTVSTWRSASSPGADGFNEIKMEDKKGQELLYMQAEKDHGKLVKNDEVSLIGNDRTKIVEHDEMSSIKNDRVKVVQHDERVSVQNDRTALVGNDEHLAVGRDRVAQIAKNETLAVGANHATQVAKNASLSVGESRSAHIGKSDQTSVGESQSVTVGQSRSATVGINDSTLVGSQYSVTIGNGLGGQLSRLLGGVLDGSVLESLGSIASPLLAGPVQKVVSGALKKTPFGDTPLTTFLHGPMATLQKLLPGKLAQVASMIPGARSLLFGAGEAPTSFTMVDKKITLTTGDATIELDGGKIFISAKESIFLQAGQVLDLTAGMDLQVQANVLVKIQAGPTPVPPTEAQPGANVKSDAPVLPKKPKPPVGDLVLVGMKQVEMGSPELMVLASKKDVLVVAEETLSMGGHKGATLVSASGETILKGKTVHLNPPANAKAEASEGPPSEPPPEQTLKERMMALGIRPDRAAEDKDNYIASKDGGAGVQLVPKETIRTSNFNLERYRTEKGDMYVGRNKKGVPAFLLDGTKPPNRLQGMNGFQVFMDADTNGTAIPLSGAPGHQSGALLNLTNGSSVYIPEATTLFNASKVTVINAVEPGASVSHALTAAPVRRDLVKSSDGSRYVLSAVSVNGTSVNYRAAPGGAQVIGARTQARNYGDGGVVVTNPETGDVVTYKSSGSSSVGQWAVRSKLETVSENGGPAQNRIRITNVAEGGSAGLPTRGRDIPLGLNDSYTQDPSGWTKVTYWPDGYTEHFDVNGRSITLHDQSNRGAVVAARYYKNHPGEIFLPFNPTGYNGTTEAFVRGAEFTRRGLQAAPAAFVPGLGASSAIVGGTSMLNETGNRLAASTSGTLTPGDVRDIAAVGVVDGLITYGIGKGVQVGISAAGSMREPAETIAGEVKVAGTANRVAGPKPSAPDEAIPTPGAKPTPRASVPAAAESPGAAPSPESPDPRGGTGAAPELNETPNPRVPRLEGEPYPRRNPGDLPARMRDRGLRDEYTNSGEWNAGEIASAHKSLAKILPLLPDDMPIRGIALREGTGSPFSIYQNPDGTSTLYLTVGYNYDVAELARKVRASEAVNYRVPTGRGTTTFDSRSLASFTDRELVQRMIIHEGGHARWNATRDSRLLDLTMARTRADALKSVEVFPPAERAALLKAYDNYEAFKATIEEQFTSYSAKTIGELFAEKEAFQRLGKPVPPDITRFCDEMFGPKGPLRQTRGGPESAQVTPIKLK